MIKRIFVIILILALMGFVVYYFIQSQNGIENGLYNEDGISEEQVEIDDEIEIAEQTEDWDTFINTLYGYTIQYPNEWEIDTDDLERIWLLIPEAEASILFASDTATQTGFPEYELLESNNFLIDDVEATISLMESEEGIRALLTVFNTNKYPHFIMFTYQYENELQNSEMEELNEQFLNRITFQ
jgi:hypothetical protein